MQYVTSIRNDRGKQFRELEQDIDPCGGGGGYESCHSHQRSSLN